MMPTHQGAFRLFRFAGINVYLHWSWFLVAVLEVQWRRGLYSSPVWNVLEYLSLFAIVTLHEFGHALACRQVGGQANQIVLWPLGGVAYVAPPQRPGATLWSIAAGPLVNVVLIPILVLLGTASVTGGLAEVLPDAQRCLRAITFINVLILAFNLLPIYPLDGGQILRSLLWFVLGRAKSLLVATIIGLVGVAGLIVLAVIGRNIWLGILAAFILVNCWSGLRQALALGRLAKLPRRSGLSCPACHAAPPVGPFWLCPQCQKPFDTFGAGDACPHCGAPSTVTRCLDCGALSQLSAWGSVPPVIDVTETLPR